jgi:hypothetical protein
MTPQRITRQRTPGWKKPEGAIIVDRTSKLWGNPWGIGTPGTIDLVLDGIKTRYQVKVLIDAPLAAVLFGLWVNGHAIPDDYLPEVTLTPIGTRMMRDHLHARRQLIRANLDQLRGHDLCCFCKPGHPCHANVLLRLANGDTP